MLCAKEQERLFRQQMDETYDELYDAIKKVIQ